MISTYTLAVEAYDEIRGIYDSSGLTPPEDDASPTYGSYAISVRRALRTLNEAKDRTYNETTTISIEDDDADDFRNLLNYFILMRVVTGAAGSATKVKVGPLEITNSSYSSLQALLSRYMALVSEILDVGFTGRIEIIDFEMDYESEFVTASEYDRPSFRGW
jgi:hypothetical protein